LPLLEASIVPAVSSGDSQQFYISVIRCFGNELFYREFFNFRRLRGEFWLLQQGGKE
jgi:hypothetical protein